MHDVREVWGLEQQVFTCPWSVHAFEYEVRHNPMAHFVIVRPRPAVAPVHQPTLIGNRLLSGSAAKETTPLVGYGGYWLIVDEAHVCTLAVHPSWRGMGLGELLLHSLLLQATALKAAVATLEVRVSNRVAQQLYRKYTFAEAGLRKGYYQDNHEDALIMTTEILASAEFQTRFQANRTALYQRLQARAS